MPIYIYACGKCEKTIEEYRTIDDRNNLPYCCGNVRRVFTAPMVTMDIEPYSTVAADKETKKREYITSRRQHREFLRRNGYEEMGNEKFKPGPKKKKDTSENPHFDVFN